MAGERVSNGSTTAFNIDPVQFGGQYGYYTDTSTGEVQLTHRYYDASTGHFLNRDPIGYKGGQNLYAFCGNNPINRADPGGNGYEPIDEIIDLGLVAADIGQIANDESTNASQATISADYVVLGLDLVGLLPLVPPGAGRAYALVTGAERALAAYKVGHRVVSQGIKSGSISRRLLERAKVLVN